MNRDFFYHISVVFSITAFTLTGCASYRDLPAGTHQQIKENSNSTIYRETVDVRDKHFIAPQPPQPYDYRLGPNDVLYVNVSGKSEFTTAGSVNSQFKGYRVDGLGYIYLPIAGKVSVAGLPLSEARDRISAVMSHYFNNPWVVVEIAEYRVRQVFVFGAVKKPGSQVMPASGINLAQALASAEIQSSGQNFKRIRIIRSNTPTDGELLVVDFDSMMRGKKMPLQLQEGDIIYVPKSAVGSWNEALADLLPSLQTVSSVLQPFVNIKYLRQ